MSRRHGFTLLEICLAVFIGLLIISLAVPSVEGVLADQALTRTFEDFDALVRRAQAQSVEERRSYRLVWEKGEIALLPMEFRLEDDREKMECFPVPEGTELILERPVAMEKDPPGEWPFWRSGTCEPVRVSYVGPRGRWVADYDALTAHGTVITQEVQ